MRYIPPTHSFSTSLIPPHTNHKSPKQNTRQMIAQLQKHVRLWFLTAIALLAAVPPAIARDFTYEYAGQTLTYTVLSEEDKTCETKQGANNYSGNYVRGEVIIPECVFDGADTYTVTTIGENSFYHQTGLTSVKIPNTVITIGSNAFYRCEDLTSIEIPSSVTIIGDKAFMSCTGLTSIEIHNSVTTIGSFAFWNCKALTSIEIPSSVTTIGERAFAECYGLTSIEIPSSVTSIGSSAFQSCTSLSSVIYNCDVTGNNLFLNSPVRDFTFGGAVVPDEMVRLLCINSVEDFTFSSPVTTIGKSAFSGISGLTSIEIPNTVTTIGESAFSGSPGLTSIEIPSTVTTIGKNAFWGCSNLTSVINNSDAYAIDMFVNSPVSDLTIGGTIVPDFMARDIGVWESLKRLTLTDKVIASGEHAFDGCTGLISVKIPNTVITIGSNAFKSCVGLTSVGLPGSVTTICNKAFYGCTGLTSVAIPNSVTTIGESAFWGCTGLNSIEIPSSVTTIGKWAFARCSNLTSVVYNSDACESSIFTDSPVSDLTIGMATVPELMATHFGIVASLIRLSFTDKVTTIGEDAFNGCVGLTSVDLPGSVTTIGNSAFYGCTGLTSIEIPSSVTTIGKWAFEGCGNIETISFASVTPPEANQNEFSELWRSARIVVPGDALTTYLDFAPYNRFYKWGTVEEPEGHSDGVFAYVFTENPPAAYIMADESYREAGPALTVPLRTNKGTTIYPIKGILPGAFHYCTNLNSVKIGNNVELIGYNAFASCNALTSVEIPNSVITIGGGAFNGCSGLTSIEIPNSVTTIGYNAFSNCYGLTSLEIPNSVATIGYGAFMGNYKVSELTLGSGLKTIGVAAFQGCARITDVVIPPFVTEIGASAFAGTGLKTVKIGCRVTSIGANAFAQVNDMTGIYVTAMAPPTAENTSFSNYSMPLYVVPGTISLYENASPCWYRFYDEGSISEQTPVTEVTVEDMLLAGAKPGDTFQIKSGVVPAEATLPHLFYVSSNPDVVQVTHEGLVTIMEPQATNDEEIETYSYREPADVEIRVYSMYDDVAPAVIKFDISTGVDDIVIGDASGEIDRSLPYEVYNLNGQMVGTDRSNLANGIYIVRQGSKVQKIAVK